MPKEEQIGNGLFDKCIIENMTEGVMTFDKTGRMMSLNKAGEKILEKKSEDLVGKSFANCFIDFPENDKFNQLFLEAIYDPENVKESFVSYYTGSTMKQIRILASYLKDDNETSGVILVLSDMTELLDLRDATKAMNKINELNAKLEERNEILRKTFGRFLSDDIVHDLLEKPDGLALGGKKARISIMMSDLRGFTALSERMDAKELLDMLNHYLGVMTEVIQKHRGTIIEFVGDGIMAVFGAPHYYDDHATCAIAAAVEMQKVMSDINAWNEEQGFPVLQMGIGLNLGEVIVGNIGSERRTKYGITGKEVNLCGRIESFTVGGEVLMSESLKKACKSPLTIPETREVVPKGAKTPMTVYKVTAIGEPYNISCEHMSEELRRLQSPIDITFFRLQEKNILAKDNAARVVCISAESCVMTTDVELELYDNIVINLPNNLYGKIIQRQNDEYLVRFTSWTKNFKEMISKLK